MSRCSLLGKGHLRTYCPTSLSLNHFHLPKLEELLDNKPPADLSITIWQDRRTFGIPRSSAKTSEWASTVPPNAFHPHRKLFQGFFRPPVPVIHPPGGPFPLSFGPESASSVDQLLCIPIVQPSGCLQLANKSSTDYPSGNPPPKDNSNLQKPCPLQNGSKAYERIGSMHPVISRVASTSRCICSTSI